MLRDHLEDILIFWGMGWDDGLDDKMRAAAAALREYDSMNQLVVKSFGSVDAVRKYSGALRAATRGISAGNDRDILKIDDRNGDWTFGQDNTYVERDDLWAVNPLTIKHGYIAFDGGRDIAETKDGDRAEMLFSVTQELPEYDDLPELDIRSKKGRDETKWKFQMAVELVCVEGPNKGAEVVYKPGSMGGLRAVRMIAEEIARRFDDEDADTHVPVVELDSRSYHNKRYNKEVYNPLMHIIEWAGLDDTKFESAGRDEEPKSGKARGGKKDEPRGNGRGRDGDDDEDRSASEARRHNAREARKSEKDHKGEPVDRRRPRDEEAVEDEPKARRRGRDEEDAEERPARGGKRTEEEPRRRTAKADVEEEPRRRGGDGEPRRGRDRDEERVETEDAPHRDETSSRGRRGARDRDEDQDDREDAKADDAPRSRRGRDEEDDRPAGPRGRRAAAGGRR